MTQSAILMGNAPLTLHCAEMWLARGHHIAAVVTRNPDLRDWAAERGLHTVAPGADLARNLGAAQVDWILSIAYLSLVPDDVLALARHGGVNFHDGPLPGYAGLNTPVWALLNGETGHGITWHRMAAGVDTGDILLERRFDIGDGDSALTLNTRCFEAAVESFLDLMTMLEAGSAGARPQPAEGRHVYARADRPEAAGLIDFTRPAAEVARLVRALDHGAYWNPLCLPKLMLDGTVLHVGKARVAPPAATAAPGTVTGLDGNSLTVACADGAVTLSELRHADGRAADPDALIAEGAVIAALPVTERARITDALAAVLPSEPFWRRRLAAMRPATLPFVTDAETLREESRPLHSGAHRGDRLLALAALWAVRACGEETCDIAWRGARVAALARDGIVAGWVPLRVEDRAEGTLEALTASTAEALARIETRGGFAADLPLRDPAIPADRPRIGIRRDGGSGLIEGTVLTVALTDTGAALVHDAARLPAGFADTLAARFEAMAGAEPATPLARIPRMSEAERDQVLHGWNRTGKPYDTSCIHAMFEAQVARTPDATALIFEGESLSYHALNERANRAAHVLAAMGVGPGTLVGLCTRRSVEMLVGALAILKAGGAYVPMDPAYPADRLALYIEDSAAPVIVTTADVAAQLPAHGAQLLALDIDPRLATVATTNPESGVGTGDLAYLIYTSGSTGRPKGVMVEHRNVANFFAGMDDRIDHANGGVWLAVTSLSFDISVLELFWTLARGFKLVLSSDDNRALVSSGQLATSDRGMEFSLYYWGNDDGVGRDKYKSLLEGAMFADTHGFCAVWTPERHFHAFGGPYPNPSVTGAAVAAVTQNLSVRAGSCVAPLHHTARIAEEWAVIDNLTNGRAGMAIASGWQPDDFVLRPENTPPANKPAMFDQIRDLRKLWKGEPVAFRKADGTLHEVVTQPRPVSADLPIWVTTAGNPETWKEAGAVGANVLTHLLGQSIDEVAGKIKLYHQALRDAGRDPADHTVTLMLHTYVADTRDEAERVAREPMKDYLRAAAGLIKQYAWAFPAFKKPEGVDNAFQLDLGILSEDELEAILDFAFLRYFEESGLFGTVEDCVARVEALKQIGVDEVACLIDYGIPVRQVLDGLRPLARVLELTNRVGSIPEDDFSIAAQILRHDVTHLQCTPSMARMIAMNEEARFALSRVKTLLLGGEPLPGALVREFGRITGARIENLYGPTETTIWSSTTRAEPGDGIVDIGTPIANTQLYVLDAVQEPVPVGVAGELWIGGDGVTRGYWQRDDLTAENFRPDPFRGNGRMYRTGDLVRRRPDGRIDFIGRADHQIKLRGHRIELGEIEAALEAQPGVEQAVVIAREDSPGDMRLVAYLRGTGNAATLKPALAARLPDHMIPAHFVTLDTFPLTPNRKIDRKALPAPARAAPAPAPDTGPATEGAERRIAAIWQRILGVAQIGPRDNFFDLGGHSLLAVQAHREIRAELGAEDLSITDIFRFPVLSALAARVDPQPASGQTAADPAQTPPATGAPSRPDRAQARSDAMSRRRAMRAARRT